MPKLRSTERVRKHRCLKLLRKQFNTPSDCLSAENQESVSSNPVINTQIKHSLDNCNYRNLDLDNDFNTDIEIDSDNEEWEDESLSNTEEYLSETEDDLFNEQNNFISEENCVENNETLDEIDELKVWAIKSRVPKKYMDSLLKILKRRLLPNLPSCSKTFLFTSTADYKIKIMQDSNNSPAEFCYLGIQNGLRTCINPLLHKEKIIKLDFNIDGVKIKKSSTKIMWPILCKINYDVMPNIYKPFSVAIFYGNGKPKSVNDYFKPFVMEINDLLLNGITIKSEKFKISIRSFICDTPARALAKGVKGHTSFNGCERCNVVAFKVDGTTVYTSEGLKRTDEGFREFADVHHHTESSPLMAIKPKINFINQFILDSMHLLYLGCMLRLLEHWMGGDLNVRISANQKLELNRRTEMLQKDIPKEFPRKMRSSNNFNDYKAVEHKFIALYCGPIVLKKILSKEVYDHFILFHVACRLLSSKEAVYYIQIARYYCNKFVENSPALYGEKFVTLNIHNLRHISDDVENMQCNLNHISAFPYESELGKIKRILLSPYRTTAQLCRRLHEEKEIINQMPSPPQQVEILKSKDTEIMQLNFKQQYLSTKHPDNSVVLNNGDIVEVKKIFIHENKIVLTVLKQKIKKSIFTSPCDSSMLQMYEIENGLASNLRIIPLADISNKLVKMSINFSADDEIRVFVVPLLH